MSKDGLDGCQFDDRRISCQAVRVVPHVRHHGQQTCAGLGLTSGGLKDLGQFVVSDQGQVEVGHDGLVPVGNVARVQRVNLVLDGEDLLEDVLTVNPDGNC